MIDRLDDLPALTRSWLAPLEREDPELYEELSQSIVVGPARDTVATALPAGMDDVLAALDLQGKEMGAFRFAPTPGEDVAEQIGNYDRAVRASFDADQTITFIGDYGQGSVFVSPEGVGLLDLSSAEARIRALARTFAGFLLAQANAYDSYKRHMVKRSDERAYRADAAACAALPALAGADVPMIFDLQLRG